MSPTFLTLDDVLFIHTDQIARYGGSSGVRDMGLLLSALGQPRATYGGHLLHSSLAEMAAAYLYHIVCNHLFVDGNKRVGTVAALVFLELNAAQFDAPENELENMVLRVAEGTADKGIIIDFFRSFHLMNSR